MIARFAGFFVASVFGLAFVLINSGPPLPPAVSMGVRGLAVAAAVAIVGLVVLRVRKENRSEEGDAPPGAPRFGAFFGVVTTIEVLLIIGGAQTISRLDAVPDQAGVAWVALIVGLHFFPLAWYWKQPEILYVAGYGTVLGGIGLAMALLGHPDWVPLVSGVVTGTGFLLGPLVVLILMNRGAGASTARQSGSSPSPK
ncbi:hypothetical protein NE857_02200 [Nocardiopsis exhalans]|uniref:DUF4386 family protein n=1 Tax=Nocardiopsis exhalans TaxID=163604 RepID=A0ABY5DAJ3_9ACTN|nr:hypothetical protein [Nocardiopsis exhalans]USY20493.1 hypothetical protein NE857_02200 [Nocardiopsis exhalans]